MTRVAVVANTKKLDKADAGRLKDALREAGLDRKAWITIEKGSAATKATAKALDRGADVVLVCGGDGTVRAASQALVGTDAALAVFPTGTANLFASAMNFPDDPSDVVELIRGGERRTIDTGTCNGLTFNIMAGAGFDAAMIDSADDDKERLGMVAYVRAGVKQARDARRSRCGSRSMTSRCSKDPPAASWSATSAPSRVVWKRFPTRLPPTACSTSAC